MSAGDRIEGAPLLPWLEEDPLGPCIPNDTDAGGVGSLHPIGMTLKEAMFMFWVVRKWKLTVTGTFHFWVETSEGAEESSRSIAHNFTREVGEFDENADPVGYYTSEKDMICMDGVNRFAGHPYMNTHLAGIDDSLRSASAISGPWGPGIDSPIVYKPSSGLYYPHIIIQVMMHPDDTGTSGVLDYISSASGLYPSSRDRPGKLKFAGKIFTFQLPIDISGEEMVLNGGEWNWDGDVTLEAVEYWPHSTRPIAGVRYPIYDTTTGAQLRDVVTGALL